MRANQVIRKSGERISGSRRSHLGAKGTHWGVLDTHLDALRSLADRYLEGNCRMWNCLRVLTFTCK